MRSEFPITASKNPPGLTLINHNSNDQPGHGPPPHLGGAQDRGAQDSLLESSHSYNGGCLFLFPFPREGLDYRRKRLCHSRGMESVENHFAKNDSRRSVGR